MDRLSIPEAAHTLGLSHDTIRKRLRSGDLQGQKITAAGGFRWEVFVFDDPTVKGSTLSPFLVGSGNVDTDHAHDTNDPNGNALVEILREELAEKNRQINELHRLLAQTTLNTAQPDPGGRIGGNC